jgi:probable HAF family extracellular repeat protein
VAGSSYFSVDANGTRMDHAFLWTSGGTDGIPSNPQMKDLGTLGGPDSHAYAIYSGSVVGDSDSTGPNSPHAFVWEKNVMFDLNARLAPNSGWVLWSAYGINATQIVGGGAYNGQGHADLITDLDGDGLFSTGSLQITDLGDVGPSGGSARAISPHGLVAGTSSIFTRSLNATLWQKNAAGTYAAQDLGTFGGSESEGWGVNDSGQVVGLAETKYGGIDAFLWQNGKMTDLDTRTYGYVQEAYAINNAGSIVGFTNAGSSARLPVLLTPTGKTASSTFTVASSATIRSVAAPPIMPLGTTSAGSDDSGSFPQGPLGMMPDSAPWAAVSRSVAHRRPSIGLPVLLSTALDPNGLQLADR